MLLRENRVEEGVYACSSYSAPYSNTENALHTCSWLKICSHQNEYSVQKFSAINILMAIKVSVQSNITHEQVI